VSRKTADRVEELEAKLAVAMKKSNELQSLAEATIAGGRDAI
jgi:hypothetical protein